MDEENEMKSKGEVEIEVLSPAWTAGSSRSTDKFRLAGEIGQVPTGAET